MTYTELQKLAEKMKDGYTPTDEELKEAREALHPLVMALERAWDYCKTIAQEAFAVIARWQEAQSLVDELIKECPNRRVKHLAKHGKKYRTRIKNINRAVKLQRKKRGRRSSHELSEMRGEKPTDV